MDATSILSTLLSTSSINGISKATDTGKTDVTNILSAAVPKLLQGASKQANTASTAASFAQALTEHSQNSTSNVTSFLKNVDLGDGAKIVSHLLGKSDTAAIAKASGTTTAQTTSVLSAAAPLLMSLLGQQTSGTSSSALGGLMSGLVSNNLGSIVGGLLGGSSGSTSSSNKKTGSNAAGLVGGLLGGLLK